MAISDNENRQAIKSSVRRNKDDTTGWWSDKQKLETVQTYLMFGNLAQTARILNIPEATVYRWRMTSWWKEIEGELKTQDELQLSAKLKRTMERSMDLVDERLENGDYLYDQKTGQMKRKPVSMKDAHRVSMDLLAKRDLILNRNVPDASEEQMSDKLLKMMQQFAEFAQKKLEKNTTVEDVDAKMVHDTDVSGEVCPDNMPKGTSTSLQEDESSHP